MDKTTLRTQLGIYHLPIESLYLRPTGDGVQNSDGSECPAHSRLSSSLTIGPFHLHVEAYQVIGMEDEDTMYQLEAADDAWAEEVEACYLALGEGCPECQQINGRWYVLRAFPFSE